MLQSNSGKNNCKQQNDCEKTILLSTNTISVFKSGKKMIIVNVYRIRGYNSVNLKSGYPTIEIRSPKDIIGYEDNETD